MLNRQAFNRGWAMLVAAFPEFLKDKGPEEIKSTVGVYWLNLKDFEDKDFERVVLAHIRRSKWFPKISELRDELVLLSGFHKATAADAWDGLIRALEQDRKPELDSPTELGVRALGGWEALSRMNYRDLQFVFKRFEESYNHGLEQEREQVRLGQDMRPAIEYQAKRLEHLQEEVGE